MAPPPQNPYNTMIAANPFDDYGSNAMNGMGGNGQMHPMHHMPMNGLKPPMQGQQMPPHMQQSMGPGGGGGPLMPGHGQMHHPQGPMGMHMMHGQRPPNPPPPQPGFLQSEMLSQGGYGPPHPGNPIPPNGMHPNQITPNGMPLNGGPPPRMANYNGMMMASNPNGPPLHSQGGPHGPPGPPHPHGGHPMQSLMHPTDCGGPIPGMNSMNGPLPAQMSQPPSHLPPSMQQQTQQQHLPQSQFYAQSTTPSQQMKPMSITSGKVYPSHETKIFNKENPNAPPIYPCGTCHREVHESEQGIFCESGCNFWYHRACAGLSEHAFNLLTVEVYAEWVCDACTRNKNIPLVKFKP